MNVKYLGPVFFVGVFGVAVSFGGFVYAFYQEKSLTKEASMNMPVPAFQAP